MMIRPSDRSESRDAIIGRATRVRGRISGEGSLVVEGVVEGDIAVRGDVTLAPGSRAASNVEASEVTLRGDLEGDVHAAGAIRIESGARVRGNINGDSVSLEDGAEFVGRVELAFDLPAELAGASAASTANRRR